LVPPSRKLPKRCTASNRWGSAAINRLHFVWLWFAAYPYAMGLITPMARIYMLGPESGMAMFLTFFVLLVNAIPAAAIGFPGYFGLALLAGHLGGHFHPAARNLFGVVVLVVGWVAGMVVQLGWYWMFQKIYEAIFG
jgi:hypothetical protein